MPSKNSIISTGEALTRVRLADIFDTPGTFAKDKNGKDKEFKGFDGKMQKIELPYRLRFLDKEDNIVSEEHSSAVLNPRNWNKKFYVRRGETDDYVTYTRESTLAAVHQIFKKGKEIPARFDINTMIGFEFDAAVRSGEGYRFIDWVQTFIANGVPVPTKEDLQPAKSLDFPEAFVQQTATPEAKPKKDPAIIDIDSLPF